MRYFPAAICKQGHIARISGMGSALWDNGFPAHCPVCGDPVIATCEECQAQVTAWVPPEVERIAHVGRHLDECIPANFCPSGHIFPWADRRARLMELRRLLGDQDQATDLMLREQLDALADGELSEEETVNRWKRMAKGVPGFWEKSGVREMAVGVATKEIQRRLGLL